MNVGCGPKICETNGRSWPAVDLTVEKTEVSVSHFTGRKMF
jgi:hypothetical protein